MIARNWLVRAVGITFVVGVLWYLLYINGVITDDRGALEPNRVIALFTIVSAVATALGWDAMRRQNKIMERQMGQTDRTLDLMRMQIRAWLDIVDELILELSPGRPIKFRLDIHNSGDVEATIIEARYAVVIRDGNFRPSQALEIVRNVAPTTAHMTVGPKQKTTIEPYSTPTISTDSFTAVTRGSQIFYLAGIYTYTDTLGHRQVMEWVYAYDRSGNRLIRKGNNE